MPAGVVYVGRPTRWGNPFPLDGDWITWTAVGLGYTGSPAGRRSVAVALHRSWLTSEPLALGPLVDDDSGGVIEFSGGTRRTMNDHVLGIARVAATLCETPTIPDPPSLDGLVGRDLACWCPLDQPCHADVLLDLANAAEPPKPKAEDPTQ